MESGRLTMLILAAVFGLGGLIVSSRAADDAFYYTGLAVFALAVLSIFALIRGLDRHEGA